MTICERTAKMFFYMSEKTKNIPSNKVSYVIPEITILNFNDNDVITESHFDPNMGEWDI